jgi:branched-chain amino acid transport system ATP-binding protein
LLHIAQDELHIGYKFDDEMCLSQLLNNMYIGSESNQLVEKAEAMLVDMNMADKRHMNAASMSRGDKRRLEIGMCLAQEPRLLLLDEPTAGMARADTNNTIDLLKQISDERDITIAIIEHDMHVVFSLAERITVLAQGTPLVEDKPENIKGHPKVREAYLGETAA